MATVELQFGALPVHVRTARLIAAAIARRIGVEASLIDEVKLAVGEACSRAVDDVAIAPRTDGTGTCVRMSWPMLGDLLLPDAPAS